MQRKRVRMRFRISDMLKESGRYQLDDNGDLAIDDNGNFIKTEEYQKSQAAAYQELYNSIKATIVPDQVEYDKNPEYYDKLIESQIRKKNSNLNKSLFQYLAKKGCDLSSEFAEWLFYSYEEILAMEANGVYVPDEVLDWAHEQKEIYEPSEKEFYQDKEMETLLADLDSSMANGSGIEKISKAEVEEPNSTKVAESEAEQQQVEDAKEELQNTTEEVQETVEKEKEKDSKAVEDSLKEYDLTSKGAISRAVEAGKKTRKMADEAKKEVKAANKEFKNLVAQRTTLTEAQNSAPQGSKESETQNAEIASLDSKIEATSKTSLKGVEKLEKFQEKNADYEDALKVSNTEMIATSATGTYGVVVGTELLAMGITTMSEGYAMIASGLAMCVDPFTFIEGLILINVGTGFVTFGSELSIGGGVLTGIGAGLIAFGQSGMEIVNENEGYVEASEASIDDSIAVLEGQEAPQRSAAEQELLDMQANGSTLTEQTVHFSNESVKETSTTVHNEVELNMMGAVAKLEQSISDAKAEKVAKDSKKKNEKIQKLEDKKEKFNEKIQSAKQEGRVPEISVNEYFSTADINTLQQTKQELAQLGQTTQNKLGASLTNVYSMYETIQTGEYNGQNAIDYGNVTLGLSKELAIQAGASLNIVGLAIAAGAAISGASAVQAGEDVQVVFDKASAKVDTAMEAITNDQTTVADSTGVQATVSVVANSQDDQQNNQNGENNANGENAQATNNENQQSNGLDKQLQTNEAQPQSETEELGVENLSEYVQTIASEIAQTGRDSETLGNEAKAESDSGINMRRKSATGFAAQMDGEAAQADQTQAQQVGGKLDISSADGLQDEEKLKQFQKINESYAQFVTENSDGMGDMVKLGLALSAMAAPMMIFNPKSGSELMKEGVSLVQSGSQGNKAAKTSTAQIEKSDEDIDKSLKELENQSPEEKLKRASQGAAAGQDINASNAVSEGNKAQSGLRGIISETESENADSIKKTKESSRTEKQIEQEEKAVKKIIESEQRKIEKIIADTLKATQEQIALNEEADMLNAESETATAKIQASQQKAAAQPAQQEGGLLAPAGGAQVDQNAVATVTANQGRLSEISSKSDKISTRIRKNQKSVIKSTAIVKKYHARFEKLGKEKIKVQEEARKAEEAKQKKLQRDLTIVNVFSTLGSIITAIGSIIMMTGLGAAIGAPIVAAGTAVILACGVATSSIQIANGNVQGGLIQLAMTVVQCVISIATLGAASGAANAAGEVATKTITTGMQTMQIASASISMAQGTLQIADDIVVLQTGEHSKGLQMASQITGALAALSSLGGNIDWSNSTQAAGAVLNAMGQTMTAAAAASAQVKQQYGDNNTQAESIVALIGAGFSTVGAITGAAGNMSSSGDSTKLDAITSSKIAGQVITGVGQIIKQSAAISAQSKLAQGRKDTSAEQIATIVGDSLSLAGSVISSATGLAEGAQNMGNKAQYSAQVISTIGGIVGQIGNIATQIKQLQGDRNMDAATYIMLVGQSIQTIASLIAQVDQMAGNIGNMSDKANESGNVNGTPETTDNNTNSTPAKGAATTPQTETEKNQTSEQIIAQDNTVSEEVATNPDKETDKQIQASEAKEVEDMRTGEIKGLKSLSATAKASIAGEFIAQIGQVMSIVSSIVATSMSAKSIKNSDPEKYLQIIGQSISAVGSVITMSSKLAADVNEKAAKREKEVADIQSFATNKASDETKKKLGNFNPDDKASVDAYRKAMEEANNLSKAEDIKNSVKGDASLEKKYMNADGSIDEEKILKDIEREERVQRAQENLASAVPYIQATQQLAQMGAQIAQSAIVLAESKVASGSTSTTHLTNTRAGRSLVRKIKSRRHV